MSPPRDHSPLGHTVKVTTTDPVPPPPRPQVKSGLNPSLTATNGVLELTSLNSNGGQPARIANLNYSNFIANTNLCGQNAVANQQSHAQLALSILGKATNRVQNLGPMEARSSVAVLTDNGFADEIASLKAVIEAFSGGGVGPGPGPGPLPPVRWVALLRALTRLLREIQRIIAHNARLTGSGTFSDPYVIHDRGPLFVVAPITLGFPNVPPSQVKFTPENQIVRIGD